MTGTPEHESWNQMRARCSNERHHAFDDYGGRGIVVCQRWRDSFEAFFADMGKRPSMAHSLDRRDNDGNYSCGKCPQCLANGWPANCRWATKKQQGWNRSVARLVTWAGQTKSLGEWADEFGLKYNTLFTRIRKGWPIERALTTPADQRFRPLAGAES